jgi:proline iminopeptidase
VALHFFSDEMARMNMLAEIANIACPTLVIGGAIDPVTPPICSQAIADAIGENAKLEMFQGCGHGPHRDDPEGAERVMRSFLVDHI